MPGHSLLIVAGLGGLATPLLPLNVAQIVATGLLVFVGYARRGSTSRSLRSSV